LIPRQRWGQADLILVTHGDADHSEYVVQVVEASGALVVCSPPLAERWQRKGVTAVPIAPDETVEAAGVRVQGVAVQHGPVLHLFGCSLALKAGGDSVGLLFTLDERRLLALGDTMLLEDEWRGLRPDVLMVPIGGVMTMNVDQALRAVAAIQPEVVIPVHYHWYILFYRIRLTCSGLLPRHVNWALFAFCWIEDRRQNCDGGAGGCLKRSALPDEYHL
jgi:L-ascorbate metabolism protein UlaG (beta-lactamase superfamily)